MNKQHKFTFKRIRTKLLALTLSVFLLSLVLVVAISSIGNYKSTMETLESTLSETARVAAGKIAAQLDGYKNLVQQIAADSSISSDLPEDQVMAVLHTFSEQNDYDYMRRTNAEGIAYESGSDVSDRDYFIACKSTGKPYISDLLLTKDTGKRVYMIAAPIMKNGTFDGVVYGAVDGFQLSKLVQQIVVGESGTAYILNGSGTTIAAYDESIVENEENVQEQAKTDSSLAELAAIEADMTAGNTGFAQSTYQGVIELTSYAPIEGTNGWSMAVTVSKAEFIASTYHYLAICIIFSIVVLVLASIVLIWFSSTLSRPIIAISREMEEFGKGNFSSELSLKADGTEIGDLVRSITHSKKILKAIIDDTARGCHEMSKGNFNISPTVEYVGEFESIEASLKQIIISLSHTLTQINEAAEQVSFGSEQVSSGSQSLAQGATEQAGTSQQLAANIATISKQVTDNASNSTIANEKIEKVNHEITKGNEEMQQLMRAMEDINNSSIEIEKIIKTIEDIAFQTNILALNAAVEAARAGAAGKGFAVVADEVRNLASKSAEAASNTTALIENSIHSVKNGTAIADQTATSLSTIVSDTKEVVNTMEQITKASHEQATALTEITQGIEQISSVVQANSATSEESAAAAEELSSQAATLKMLVQQFKVKNLQDKEFLNAFTYDHTADHPFDEN